MQHRRCKIELLNDEQKLRELVVLVAVDQLGDVGM